jgi:hypothetical protein
MERSQIPGRYSVERLSEALVTADEPQSLIESVSVQAPLVGRQRERARPACSRYCLGVGDHSGADALRPKARGDLNTPDPRNPRTPPCHGGNEGQLEATDHLPIQFRDKEKVVRAVLDRLERGLVCGTVRKVPCVSVTAEIILRMEPHDGWQIGALGFADENLHPPAPLMAGLPETLGMGT